MDIDNNIIQQNSETKRTCVLGMNGIIEERKSGNIGIEPFNINRVNPCSYDISLGPNYYEETVKPKFLTWRENDNSTTKIPVFNPYIGSHVQEKWGLLMTAKTIYETLNDTDITSKYKLTMNHFENDVDITKERIIILAPNSMILAHTIEKIGGLKGYTGLMKAKSSIGRCSIRICCDAGWGDEGFCDVWTMEIKNESPNHATIIYVGRPIGQIIFFSVHNNGEGNSYVDRPNSRYITTGTEWNPSTMLPRLHWNKNKNEEVNPKFGNNNSNSNNSSSNSNNNNNTKVTSVLPKTEHFSNIKTAKEELDIKNNLQIKRIRTEVKQLKECICFRSVKYFESASEGFRTLLCFKGTAFSPAERGMYLLVTIAIILFICYIYTNSVTIIDTFEICVTFPTEPQMFPFVGPIITHCFKDYFCLNTSYGPKHLSTSQSQKIIADTLTKWAIDNSVISFILEYRKRLSEISVADLSTFELTDCNCAFNTLWF